MYLNKRKLNNESEDNNEQEVNQASQENNNSVKVNGLLQKVPNMSDLQELQKHNRVQQ